MSVGGFGGGGNSIITDGLIFSIDPYNTKSYISGSTVVNNLLTNGNNGTLINGVTFDDLAFEFNDTNQYISFGSSGIADTIRSLTKFTIDVWVKKPDNGDLFICGMWSGVESVFCQYGPTEIMYIGTSTAPGNSNNIAPFDSGLDNTWVNITYVFDLDEAASVDKGKMYMNTELLTNTTNNLTDSSVPAGSQVFNIGATAVPSAYFGGLLGVCNIYNKSLNSTEIIQNNNALKGRFR